MTLLGCTSITITSIICNDHDSVRFTNSLGIVKLGRSGLLLPFARCFWIYRHCDMVSSILSNLSNFLALASTQFSLILLLSVQFLGIKVGFRKTAKTIPDKGDEACGQVCGCVCVYTRISDCDGQVWVDRHPV